MYLPQVLVHNRFEYKMYTYVYIYIYIYLPRTQMTHIFEDLTHRMEGHPFKKEVSWGLGI